MEIKREEPKEYEIYRHFKGSFYQIVAVAVHTETKEKMVVYRALKNSMHVFVRPLAMFMSEVDREKYPNVSAKFRFTKIENDEVNITLGKEIDDNITSEINRNETVDITCTKEDNEKNATVDITQTKEDNEKNEAVDIAHQEGVEEKNGGVDITLEDDMDTRKYKEDGTLVIDPLVERLLDEKEFTKKIEVLQLLRNKCTDEMLTQIAISLDIKLTSDTIEGKYAEILKVLRMHEKYESGRRI